MDYANMAQVYMHHANLDHANMEHANIEQVNVEPTNMEPITDIKNDNPNPTKLDGEPQLREMWAVSSPSRCDHQSQLLTFCKANQNSELNLLGALNACQSTFDNTTFWERDNRNGYHNFQINDAQACFVARQNSINNINANNKMYTGMEDFYAEQQKAYSKLCAYNLKKYSKETIRGTNRQKAARGGAATRKANKAKRHEEMVIGIGEEIIALRDYSGVLDEKYKKRFDMVVKRVLAATKVNMTPKIFAMVSEAALDTKTE
ncbi:unnamed protein product [Aureobasidium vineae]|uniref:Uncharacterized protein n=1 Tax=Aureobasidium vineae TaxID=2773715 RepID=A0A9N8P7T6_9PEZI|nr:unnamed protein product [Aureobasidium vineae]